MTLGERLVRLRSRAGLSQDALAERLGVSRQSVSKWETDTSIPDLDKLMKLSEVFDITLDELVKGEGPASAAPQAAGGAAALWQKLTALYREKAYRLGWLLVAWCILRFASAMQAYASYYQKTDWESTQKLINVLLPNHIFILLTLLTGLFIVCWGKRYAGRFRWYHLGWCLVIMGLFGIPQSVRFLSFGPLESLLNAVFLHLRFYGPDRMLEVLSLWPEDIDNLLLCAAGAFMLILGARTSRKKKSAE